MRILVLNTGSSSIKASVLEVDAEAPTVPVLVSSTHVDSTTEPSHEETGRQVRALVDRLADSGVAVGSIDAVAHRIVHGGTNFPRPIVVDDRALREIGDLASLAPLHNPVAVAAIQEARIALPGRPNVAVFDTSFHASLPETAWRYPVPEKWTTDFGVRRFGFHGLSVQWSVERAGVLLSRASDQLALVVAHLGNGCSVTAVTDGRSVATSMGMTPLEGLMMGTRSGSIDPGVMLRLIREGLLSPDEMAEDLDRRSGLLAVSGSTADVRVLGEAASGGDTRAARALEMFTERAAAGIAAAATALPRLDAVIFTGGIGEHAGVVRAGIVARLAVLGVGPIASDESGEDRILAGTGTDARAAVPVLRVEAREDIVAARAAWRLLDRRAGTSLAMDAAGTTGARG